MDINPNPKINNSKPTNSLNRTINTTQESQAAIVFEIDNKEKKKVTIKSSKIKQITKGIADIAFSLGHTNDPEELSKELHDDIYEAMQEAQIRYKKQKKNHPL